jgi:hypothetical protein
MHPSSTFRYAATAKHPPYGLYFDPHHGRHSWTAVNPRLLLAIVTVIGGVGALFTLLGH